MPTRIPDLSASLWTSRLASLLERTALAIGRLDARISATPVRAAWEQRAAWSGFTAALRGQGAEIDEIDLFARACGVTVPNRTPVATHLHEDELSAAKVFVIAEGQMSLAPPELVATGCTDFRTFLTKMISPIDAPHAACARWHSTK